MPAAATPPVGAYQHALWWAAVVVAVAGASHWAATGSDWSATMLAAPPLVALIVATVLAALDPLLFIRIKTERGSVSYGFGEISFVAACFLVPPELLPATTLVGVFAAQLTNLRLGRLPTFSRVLSSAGALALSAAAGAAVVSVVSGPVIGALTPSRAVAVGAGAMTFCMVSVVLVSTRIAMTPPTQRWVSVLESAVRRKVPMGVGNTAVGLAGAAAVTGTRWSLLAVPPIIALLHQTYAYRLRSENERRGWQTFASVTRELNHHLDEQSATAAGLAGAQRLFTAHRAEIVIDGSERSFHLADDGDLVALPLFEPGTEPVPVAERPLLVAGARVGTLRLFGAAALTGRELLMLSAYGDAIAASLHDAATSTELRALSKRNTYNAERDSATGLANRNTLLEQGTAMLTALSNDTPVALLLLDINHFKEINTTLGHAAGDDLLRIIGYRLAADRIGDDRAAAEQAEGDRPGELLARLGGDEFALLVTGDAARLPPVLDRARHLAETLAEPTVVAGVQLSIEASIGAVAVENDGISMTELLRRADVAMYCAKRDHATVASYDPTRDEAGIDRVAMLAELREALADKDQLYLLLQPAVALDTGLPVSVEALVRWGHPRRGELKPVDFVRAVEQSDLLGPFTRHVLDLALAVAARLRGRGVELPVSVNLSPRSLLDKDLPDTVAHLLARHGVPAPGLVLDIVETVVISKLPVVDEVLARLGALGVQLAVDDFGTGCSALTFLTQVTVDEVKIDRTFVTSMHNSAEAAAIVRTTIELGEDLGLRVVAEGVETAAQRKALAALGCRLAQGYLFFLPAPVDSMVETLCTVGAPPRTPIRRVKANSGPPRSPTDGGRQRPERPPSADAGVRPPLRPP